MKKVFFMMVLSLMAFAVTAQTTTTTVRAVKKEARKVARAKKISLRSLKGEEVSYQSKQQFATDFGVQDPVSWKRAGYFDEATFARDGKQVTAYYDETAQLVGTTTPATFKDLPVSAQRHIEKNYTGYDAGQVLLFDDNESNETDMILYGVQLDDEDNYFIEVTDKKGKKVVLRVSPAGDVEYLTDMR